MNGILHHEWKMMVIQIPSYIPIIAQFWQISKDI